MIPSRFEDDKHATIHLYAGLIIIDSVDLSALMKIISVIPLQEYNR